MFATILALALVAGPPWISIEYPGNPMDRSTRDAYLLVHTFHHETAVQADLVGEAVTWVNGQRRAVPLRFAATSRPGVYKLTKQWTDGTPYVLVIAVGTSDHGSGATALVSVSAAGALTKVEVPSRPYEDRRIPRAPTEAEIAGAFRAAGGAA